MLLNKKRQVTLFTIVVLFFTLYITPDYNIGGIKIPFLIPYLICFSIVTTQLINFKFDLVFFKGVILILFLVISGVIFVPSASEYLFERLTGSIQLLLSFMLLACLLRNARNIDSNVFFGIIEKLFYLLFAIACLERLGIFTTFFDVLRGFFYQSSMYVGFERDLNTYGHRRPMALMKEPAHLAWLSSLLLFTLYKSKVFTLYKAILFSILLISIISSPIMIIVFLAIGLDHIYNNKKSALVYILIGILLLTLALKFIFYERLLGLTSGTDLSFLSRVLGPPIVAFNVIKDYPVFGLGLTSDTLTATYVYDVFFRFSDLSALERLDDEILAKRVTNYFFQSFVYLGLLGTLSLFLLLKHIIKKSLSNINIVIVFLQFIVFSLGMGGVVTAKVFSALFLLSYVYFIEGRVLDEK